VLDAQISVANAIKYVLRHARNERPRTLPTVVMHPEPRFRRLRYLRGSYAARSKRRDPRPRNRTKYGYDPVSNGMNLVTDKRGNSMVQNLFDANGRVSQQTLADNAVWKFSYTLDANGNVTQTTITDPRNYVRQETFNSSGYVTQRILAMGQPEQQSLILQRDASNLVQNLYDPLNRQSNFSYDAFGDLTYIGLLVGTSSQVAYQLAYTADFHQLAAVTDPLGHTANLGYGTQGRLLTVTDALGNTTNVTSNAAGLPTQVADPLSHATTLGYSGGDLTSITDALSRTTTISTDSVGRVVGTVDPMGHQTQYAFDAVDRLTQVADALGNVTQLTYDHNGNLLSVKDPRNVTPTFTYDVRDRKHTYLDPTGKTETYLFDGMSNLTSVTDRKSQLTTIGNDGINRPTLITFQDGSTIAITWDGGNRATKFVDSLNGTITRQYDGLDNLVQEVTPQGQVNWTYDAASRRQTMTVLGKPVVNYTFDNADRLTQVAQGTVTLGFGYDTASRRTTVTLPNGIIGTYAFDNANQLSGITYKNGGTTVGTLGYGYDFAGRRTSLTGTLANWAAPNFAPSNVYDGTNRLTASNGTSLVYDNDGNLTSFGSTSYTWNARNQLTGASAGSASFGYDPVGRRVSTTIGGTTVPFLYDGANPVTINGNFQIAGLGFDEIEAQIVGSTATSFLRDGLNSTVALTNSSAAITANYGYSAYGDTTVAGTSANSLEYTGRENDGATGLYFYRARYYSPQLGRFISEDPIGLGGGSNYYAYTEGNPITNADPSGLITSVDMACAMDPQFCLEIMGQIIENHGAITATETGDQCLADQANRVANGFRMAGTIAGVVQLAAATKSVAKAFSSEKQALLDMAKADRRRGVTRADMDAYDELNKGLPDPFPLTKVRIEEGHLTGGPHSRVPHGHVGSVDHIPIVDP
jgi:RHS repeat-associated protein